MSKGAEVCATRTIEWVGEDEVVRSVTARMYYQEEETNLVYRGGDNVVDEEGYIKVIKKDDNGRIEKIHRIPKALVVSDTETFTRE